MSHLADRASNLPELLGPAATQRGPEIATAFLGVARSVVCAPLNPDYQLDEFGFYLADLGVKAVVVEAGSDSPARAAAAG